MFFGHQAEFRMNESRNLNKIFFFFSFFSSGHHSSVLALLHMGNITEKLYKLTFPFPGT